MLLCGAAAWAAARALPALIVPLPGRGALAIAVLALGLAIELVAAARFLRARTTVSPLSPQKATTLVTGGLNRVSRNPMYVGQALLLAGWALWLAHALAPLGAVAYVLWITRFQILPEERALAARFGEDYAAYRARTPRWL
ncbi:MAG: isoprenylcysteine carboxylmethyltransferase family protein [Xanthomonadales bacterium]|nr:isoprenylcysteine carboxylmethyltransferase family protein [Xanthomonadales bacterium]